MRGAAVAKKTKPRRLTTPLGMFAASPQVTPRVQAAFDEAVRKFMQRDTVTGIDVGFKAVGGRRTATLAIRIHVREKFAARALSAQSRFPKAINGVPVDVIEAVYESQSVDDLQVRVDPVRPGVSIGRLGDTAGTMGVVVTDNRRASRPGFLTAGHVLFSHNGSPGDIVVQPGPSDGGVAADVVATVARAFTPSDAALAVFTGDRAVDPTVAISGVTLTAPREPALGDVLEKCGRSTGVTRATVDGIGHFMGVRDSFHLVGLDDNPIVEAGDSGAMWYDPVTGAAIGLHCKGPTVFTPSANFAVASRLTEVTKKIGVTVVV